MVGLDQMPAPEGPCCWTPFEFLWVGWAASAMVNVCQIFFFFFFTYQTFIPGMRI